MIAETVKSLRTDGSLRYSLETIRSNLSRVRTIPQIRTDPVVISFIDQQIQTATELGVIGAELLEILLEYSQNREQRRAKLVRSVPDPLQNLRMALGSNYVSGLISKYKIGDATGEELRHKFLMSLNANAANASRTLELAAANRTLERNMQYGGGLSNAIVRALHLKSEDDIPRAIFHNSAFNPTRAEIRDAIGDVFPQKDMRSLNVLLRHASNLRKTRQQASNTRKTRRQFKLPSN